MNWVGGARRRIKGFNRNDRKIQKEYFERKRLSAEALKAEDSHESKVKAKNKSNSSKQGSKVSQDLLAFQIARKASQSRGTKEQANFRVLDLGKKKTVPSIATIAGKCIQTIDLPVSPQESPSLLNLSGSSENDSTKKGYNSQQFHRIRNDGDSRHLFFHSNDATRKEDRGQMKTHFMDFMGEKMPIPLSKQLRERTQHHKREHNSPNQQQSAVCGYQTDLSSSRSNRSQNFSLSHCDTESDMSSLVSSFPNRKRPIDNTGVLAGDALQAPATWCAQNSTKKDISLIHSNRFSGHSNLSFLSHSDTEINDINGTQKLQRRLCRDNVQEIFSYQRIKSPMMNFNLDKTANNPKYSSLKDTETTSSGSFFPSASSYLENQNAQNYYEIAKPPAPPFFLFHDNQTRQIQSEKSPSHPNSLFKTTLCHEECGIADGLSSLFNSDRAKHRNNKPRASEIQSHFLQHLPEDRNRVKDDGCQKVKKTGTTCRSELSGNLTENVAGRWDSREDLHQNCETRCRTPIAIAEASSDRYKPAGASTPRTPVNNRGSFEKLLYRNQQPPDTVSTSTFSVTRGHIASPASNIYQEVCSLEDQVHLRKEKISGRDDSNKTYSRIEKILVTKNNIDSDVVALVTQMVDYVVMDQTLLRVLHTTVKKYGSQVPAYSHKSTLGLLCEDRVQICDSSSKSPLNLAPVVSRATEMELMANRSVQSVGCETDGPKLVDVACSPLRVVCPQFQPQRRYNTRRQRSAIHFSHKLSPRPPTHKRKSKRTSTKEKGMKEEEMGQNCKLRQLNLTQPED